MEYYKQSYIIINIKNCIVYILFKKKKTNRNYKLVPNSDIVLFMDGNACLISVPWLYK